MDNEMNTRLKAEEEAFDKIKNQSVEEQKKNHDIRVEEVKK